MSIEIVTLLASISASSTVLRRIHTHTDYSLSGYSEQVKPLQLVGLKAEFKFEPLQVML